MRTLMVRQKKLLDKLIKKYANEDIILMDGGQLSVEEWDALERINDTEILWQEVNRYLRDKCWE